MICKVVDLFTRGAVFNAGGYFRTDHHVLVCGSFSVSFSSSMLNLIWSWDKVSNIELSLGCLFHYFDIKVSWQQTFGGNLCHVVTSKLICQVS